MNTTISELPKLVNMLVIITSEERCRKSIKSISATNHYSEFNEVSHVTTVGNTSRSQAGVILTNGNRGAILLENINCAWQCHSIT